MTKQSHVYSWVMGEKSLDTGYGIQFARKKFRSRDLIFLEEETSEDVERGEKNKIPTTSPINLSLYLHPKVMKMMRK